MSKKSAEQLSIMIRMLRELDTRKNKPEEISAVLNFIAHELELILGGFYE